jgi:ferric-dicitrate binding protein FerR (iron transport regulator)
MTSPRCVEIEAVIDREALGWSEAERLRVEHHLGDCEECRRTLAMSRMVRDTITTSTVTVSENATERALARAFDNVARGVARHDQKVAPRRIAMAMTVLVAAAAAAVLWMWTPRAAELAPRAADPSVTLAQGKPREQTLPAPQVEPSWIETSQEEQRTFGHASVRLAAATRVRFDEAQSDLLLEHGRLDIHVDASLGKGFSVTTRRFRAHVLGTKFLVTDDTVSVTEGRVRVVDLEGKVLAPELHAGERFTYGSRSEPAAASPEHARSVSARVWLVRARQALIRGDSEVARTLIARADDSRPRRQDRAEALTLRAEAALIERDTSAAIRFYENVARQYGDMTAGENAAFAAAQLTARSQPERARALYQRYLTRYPEGRFSAEARTRLQSVPR